MTTRKHKATEKPAKRKPKKTTKPKKTAKPEMPAVDNDNTPLEPTAWLENLRVAYAESMKLRHSNPPAKNWMVPFITAMSRMLSPFSWEDICAKQTTVNAINSHINKLMQHTAFVTGMVCGMQFMMEDGNPVDSAIMQRMVAVMQDMCAYSSQASGKYELLRKTLFGR